MPLEKSTYREAVERAQLRLSEAKMQCHFARAELQRARNERAPHVVGAEKALALCERDVEERTRELAEAEAWRKKREG